VFIRTCGQCGEDFVDRARRQICRRCKERSHWKGQLSWAEVARRWQAISGEDLSEHAVRAIAASAINKIRFAIRNDIDLARDLSESGLPFVRHFHGEDEDD